MFTRAHDVSAFERSKDGKELRVKMAFASDRPYERWWGIEILDMGEKSVRLGRLNDGDGGSVLFNHNWNDLRGRHAPGSVKVSDDGFLRGEVIIPDATQTMRDTQALVESRTLSKASVGYEIHTVVELSTAKDGSKKERTFTGEEFRRALKARGVTRDNQQGDGDIAAFQRDLDAIRPPLGERKAGDEPPIYRVMDWEPLENSFVTVPADTSVGVGRSVITNTVRVEVDGSVDAAAAAAAIAQATRAASQQVTQPAAPAALQEKPNMAEQQPAAGTNAEQRLDPLEVAKRHKQAVGNLCKTYNIDARVEDQWVRDGTPLDQISEHLLKIMEERGKAKPTAASDLGLTRAETQRFSVFKAIRAMRTPSVDNMNAAAYEIECSRAVAKRIGREDSGSIFVPGEVLQRPLGEAATRAMATTPGAAGGYLVNVENMGFIDILRNRSVLMKMGARRLPGLVGNVVFPRQTGKATVVWQGGEGVSVTASDQTLGQLSMTPKTAIAITDVSEQLLRQSSPSAEAFIMADLAADVAIDGVDNKGINGVGGAEPLGIKNTTGISSSQDAATATYAKILAFVSTAGGNNAIRGNPGFITTTAGASVLMQKQRFSSTDTPVWEGNMMDGTLVGFRAMSSEQLASGNLIFGSFDELVIGEWGVLELAMDNGGTRFNQAQVGIRAMWMVDVLLRYPQSFVVSTNLSA
jgi:HK97 family phage major capsid protein